MEIIPFVKFTFKKRYILRWLLPGVIIYIPGLNLFSIGYLSKTSKILLIGDVGLPPWQNWMDIFFEGLNLLFIFILYEAIPFFFFFSGVFFTSLSPGNWLSFGHILEKFSYLSLLFFSFFLPFAFALYSESGNIKKAFEFEGIYRGIKDVFSYYIGGYLATLLLLYISKIFLRIPYLGFVFSSLAVYYILLLATYYFTHIYKKTNLTSEITGKNL